MPPCGVYKLVKDNSDMKKTLISCAAGALLALLVVATYQTAQHISNIAPASTETATPVLKPLAVDPSWVKQGTPNFRATEFFKSSDGKTSSGIFECDASTFEWRYQLDEAVYILDGSVELDYQGKRFTLKAGDSAFFRAGTTAIWHVPSHIRKTWTLYDAGKVARTFAKVSN